MTNLSETAFRLFDFLSQEIAIARKEYPTTDNFSFKRDDIVQYLHSNRLEKVSKETYQSWLLVSKSDIKESFEELVNAGIFLIGVDGRYRLADPSDIVKQRMMRGSYTGDTDNLS